jgi:hypothetical protein
MDALIPDAIKIVLLVLLAVAMGLGWLARRLPQVAWLQLFRLPTVQLTEEQRARRHRAANRGAALEMIFAGFVLPLLYVVSTVMMFNDFKTIPTLLVGACSLCCIGLGIWMLVRNR